MVAVVRKMPIKSIPAEAGVVIEKGEQTLSVELPLDVLLDSDHLKNGWNNIGPDHGLVIDGTSWKMTRPFNNERDTDTAFIKPSLSTP